MTRNQGIFRLLNFNFTAESRNKIKKEEKEKIRKKNTTRSEERVPLKAAAARQKCTSLRYLLVPVARKPIYCNDARAPESRGDVLSRHTSARKQLCRRRQGGSHYQFDATLSIGTTPHKHEI